MIRLQSFDAESLIPVLSGLVCQESSKESYTFVNMITKMLPSVECVQDTYLIIVSLEKLYEIYSMSNLIPAISKDSIINIIEGVIYEEVKENKQAGFAQYARTDCQIELDTNNEESIDTVCNKLLSRVLYILDESVELGYSLEQSLSQIPSFHEGYISKLMFEASSIMDMMSNADYRKIGLHFWGWTKFLNKHRINSSKMASVFLSLVADTIRSKDTWAVMDDGPLKSIGTVIDYKKSFIENSTPIMNTPVAAFDAVAPITPKKITVLVASKGVGKTTFASYLSGMALAMGLKVMFYSPETPKDSMLFVNILPAYIRSKYGFFVTPEQCIGLASPYEEGSEYTAEEKEALIQLAIQELTDDANFMHVDEYYYHDRLESDMRAHVKGFDPDILVFDHTTEILGDVSDNEKTANLAITCKKIVKDYPTHILILSHPGSQFTTPSLEKPIIKDVKINAWSKSIETVADTIIGAVAGEGDQFKTFYTKSRWGKIPPMFIVYRMNKKHGWFDFRNEDQFALAVDSRDAVKGMLAGKTPNMEFKEEQDEDYGFSDED